MRNIGVYELSEEAKEVWRGPLVHIWDGKEGGKDEFWYAKVLECARRGDSLWIRYY